MFPLDGSRIYEKSRLTNGSLISFVQKKQPSQKVYLWSKDVLAFVPLHVLKETKGLIPKIKRRIYATIIIKSTVYLLLLPILKAKPRVISHPPFIPFLHSFHVWCVSKENLERRVNIKNIMKSKWNQNYATGLVKATWGNSPGVKTHQAANTTHFQSHPIILSHPLRFSVKNERHAAKE